ncbi:hypothetical protein VB715_02610 [Crocosphaera sp. UHCC 0190]|uniref:hypothetical protein n=1 Tax=Crocosphaera sp. UHCC 0190 TaxID=3110246 RepID=UPI002B1F6EDD|nr:hypothetical protein [Crocosphaera sp. UHCC 0190]MEA5508647.1 hypothetical protein [Crocosphaera sp. UHCC 0190]
MFMSKKLGSICLTTTLLLSLINPPKLTLAQETVDNLIVNLCQTSIKVKLANNQGRDRVNMTFDSVEKSPLSGGQQSIRGRARIQGRNNERPLSYNCTINVTDGLISQSSYTFEENVGTSSIRLCQDELRNVVKRDRDGLVEFNQNPETYSISNTEEGVRGIALIQQSRQPNQNYRFDCNVDIRQGKVTKISYSPDSSNSNRPRANTQEIIRLCQDNIRQRISSNQINIGGIIGINLGTGRRIEFRDSADTFYISDNQEGVRGSAVLTSGFQQSQVNYECTVDLEQGTVTNVTVQ